MLRGVRGGVFGALEGCLAGDFRAVARRGWAVLPRNSGVFEWRKDVARRFSARRTLTGSRGKKFFKKGVKNLKTGVWEVLEGGLGAPYIRHAGRFLGLETRLLAALLEVQ